MKKNLGVGYYIRFFIFLGGNSYYQVMRTIYFINNLLKNSPDKGLEPLALRLKVSRSTD